MIKRLIPLLVVFICALTWACLMSVDFLSFWHPQAAPAAGGHVTKVEYVDQTNFPNVTVYVSVLDGSGQPVMGLTESDFSVTEDGSSRDITDFIGGGEQPVTAVMLIDHSGSMEEETKMEDAIEAAVQFLDHLQDGRDRLGVIAFDDTSVVLSDLQLMDGGARAGLRSQIGSLRPAGGTAYYDTIYQAVEMLSGISGRKVVLALTDGIDTISRYSRSSVIRHARDNNVVVFTIGLGTQLDRGTLRQIARDTGGTYYERPSGGDLAQLYVEIAQGLQSEYSLTYESATPKLDGTTRQVEVAARVSTGTVTGVGGYAVGGTFAPSFNVWPCLGGFALLVLLLGLLALPSLYDLVRGRRQLAGPAPAPVAVPRPKPAPAAAPPVQPRAPGSRPQLCPACGSALRAGARFCPSCGASSSAPSQPAPLCANCGAPVRPDAKFCRACGQPAVPGPEMSTCPHCGAALKPAARFCAKCGQRV